MKTIAKRQYQLPGIDELSREQEAVNYLPAEGCHLVVGGPGTGKTVIALMRARLFEQKGLDYVFLVYNKLLERASRQLNPGVNSNRWIRWFNGIHKSLFRSLPPRLSKDWADMDWNRIQDALLERDCPKPLKDIYLIIDEGQDMPLGFYQTLLLLGAENIFVAADQNQQIDQNSSSIEDIRLALNLETGDIHYLTENFRQKDHGYYIARLAREFYTDPASPPPALPPKPMLDSPDIPLLFTHTRQQFDKLLQKILVRVANRPDRLIGIITAIDKSRIEWLKALWEAQKEDHRLNFIPVRTYFSEQDEKLLEQTRFDQGGILVINSKSSKGLEFDEVFIINLEDFRVDPNDNNMSLKTFYVMISRAREKLFMLRQQERPCPVLKLMPEDPEILRRLP